MHDLENGLIFSQLPDGQHVFHEDNRFHIGGCYGFASISQGVFYHLLGGEFIVVEGSLEPVLSTLKHLKSKGIHTEIVNLVVTGKNDDKNQIRSMCRWVNEELGPDVPLHYSRFYPRYKLKGVPPTPISTLEMARDTAMMEGLRYVYIGNVPEHPGGHTYCPKCKKALIHRIGYRVSVKALSEGKCTYCGASIPGIWKL